MATPQWTMMLYLSGDNNLSPEMVRALNDIGVSGVPLEVNLAIQYAPLAPNTPTYRYFLPAGTQLPPKPDRGPLPLREFAEEVAGAPSAASAETLTDFIVASVKKYRKTPNRMLVLSGHGGGAVGDFLTNESPRPRQPRSLTIPRLRTALDEARKKLREHENRRRFIQVLGMDSCLMSMIEVCYEVRHVVEYLVGSEGFVPNAGWPYAYFFEKLTEKIRNHEPLTAESISECIVTNYVGFYRDYMPASVSVDIAACELKKLDGVTKSLSELADHLSKGIHSTGRANGKANGKRDQARDLQNKVILAHWRAQSFQREQNTDLYDFCEQLAIETRGGPFGPIAVKCEAVMKAVHGVTGAGQGVPGRQRTVGIDTQYARGLALYFPWSLPIYGEARVLEPYRKLQFPRASGWGKFIETYVRETRRPPAGDGELWPPDKFIKHVNQTGVVASGGGVREAADYSREAADYSRDIAEEDRVLLQLFGSGTLPWSMKNPPQQVKIPPARPHKRPDERTKAPQPPPPSGPLPQAPGLAIGDRIEAPQPHYQMHS